MGWSAGTPGKTYSIELRAEGRTSARATVTGPEPGQTVTLRRELPAAELPRAGKLNVQATPGWAKVFIDGAYVSTTPLIGHELPAGSYSIRLENDRLGADISDSITIRPGETTIKAYQLDR